MKKSYVVLTLMLCLALILGLLGCSGGEAATTTVVSATTTTTVAPTTTTVAPTTTTTTETPGSWSELEPAADPPAARMSGVMINGPVDSPMLLFGGYDGTEFYNGIWSYDPASNTWTDLDPNGNQPSGRALQSMALDTVSGKVIMFGGYDGATYLDDTWAFDIAENTWTNLSPAGEAPSPRGGQTMIYSPVTRKLILFGGWDGKAEHADTWAYDATANTWTELSPAGDVPQARDSYSFVYDLANAKLLLFGGWDETGELNDTWAYDPAANTWTNLDPGGTLVPGRALQQMVYEPGTGKVILFGGATTTGVVLNDTWIYDPAANSWTEVKPAGTIPSARTGHCMLFDSATNRVLLFAGSDGGAYFNDVWTYSR